MVTMLRETGLVPMDVLDLQTRRIIRGSCVRVASAYDAGLLGVRAGPVKKITVALWTRRDVSDDSLQDDLSAHDDVLEIGKNVNAQEVARLDSHDRAAHLLAVHHSAISAAAERYGWTADAFRGAYESALANGILAKLTLPPVLSPNGRWEATASGVVTEDGIMARLTIVDAGSNAVVADDERRYGGDWHVMRGLLSVVVWKEDVAVVRPVRRLAKSVEPPLAATASTI